MSNNYISLEDVIWYMMISIAGGTVLGIALGLG